MTRFLMFLWVGIAISTSAMADVTLFDGDREAWMEAAARFTTIGFTGFDDELTIVTDQYLALGVLFTDGNDAAGMGCAVAPNDCWGLAGGAAIDLTFHRPMHALAIDFPGGIGIELIRNGESFYQSGSLGGSGAGHFAGVVSDEPFDAAILSDGIVNTIDDLHFGPPVCWPDLDGDRDVDVDDLVGVLLDWGCTGEWVDLCPSDVNYDGIVDVDDLTSVITAWGMCAEGNR